MNKDCLVGIKTNSGTKIYVNIKSKENRQIGLSLYQPYSIKGKLVTLVIKYLNPLVLKLFFNFKVAIPESLKALHYKKIINLENASFLVSATAEKMVIVSRVSGKISIVKLSNNAEVIKNEILARQHFQELMLTPRLGNHGLVLEQSYIAFDYIDGVSRKLQLKDMIHFIEVLKKREEFILQYHPRVRKVMLKLLENNCPLNPAFEHKITRSDLRAKLVVEHGDFTPWNVKTDIYGDLYLYDWENYNVEGLEYFDEIHFLFTIHVFLKCNMDEFVTATKELYIPEIIVELYLLNRYYIVNTDNQKINTIILKYLIFKSVVNAY